MTGWIVDTPPNKVGTRGRWQRLIRDFHNSGDDCWSHEFETIRQAHDRCANIREASKAMHRRHGDVNVRVTRKGTKVYLVREDPDPGAHMSMAERARVMGRMRGHKAVGSRD